MRESLHQLTVTLALPIAVTAVWIARGDATEPRRHERATAYRVELAELPLPTRERLRAPGLSTAAPAPRPAPQEEAAPPERRAVPPAAPQADADAVDLAFLTDSDREAALASRTDSEPERIAPSTLPSLDTLGAAPRGTPSPIRGAAPAAQAAPSLASSPVKSSASQVASTATAEPASAQTAQSSEPAPVSSAGPLLTARPNRQLAQPVARPVDDTAAGRPVGREPVVRPVDNTPVTRLADDTSVGGQVANTPVGRPVDDTPAVGHAIGKELGNPSPIFQEPRNDRGPSDIPARSDGSAPLVPHGEKLIVAWTEDFSLPLEEQPSVLPTDPPPLALDAQENQPGHEIAIEIPVPGSILRFSGPTFFVIPEPGSGILLGASLAALGVLRRSRRA
jgi:hypothetical protein